MCIRDSVKEPLTGEMICSWITGSQGTTAVLDQEKVVAFVAGLAAKYDTAGTARTFHTAGGKDVEITGPYGWKLDVAGESAALTQLIQAGLAEGEQDREPVYAATAASRTAPDWGTTYVEIDLTGQHVYMFQEGSLVWEAPCVTGNIAKNYDTPAGIYSLTYKEKDRILRGAKKADGSYEYESHVDYWMPFNGGIGLSLIHIWIMEVTPEFLGEQLDDIFTDIFPDAVKIGMVSSSRLIEVIADKLSAYHGVNIVVDPVMVATSGSRLIDEAAVQVLKERLIPMADLLTPNVPEAEILSGIRINSQEDMEEAARIIGENCGCAVLCKGGHQHNDANDLLYRNGELRWFMGKRIQNPNTHGTGCTLSSAIASNLAKGMEMDMAVEKAKAYLSGALGAMLDLGRGSGPMNHAFAIKGEY